MDERTRGQGARVQLDDRGQGGKSTRGLGSRRERERASREGEKMTRVQRDKGTKGQGKK